MYYIGYSYDMYQLCVFLAINNKSIHLSMCHYNPDQVRRGKEGRGYSIEPLHCFFPNLFKTFILLIIDHLLNIFQTKLQKTLVKEINYLIVIIYSALSILHKVVQKLNLALNDTFNTYKTTFQKQLVTKYLDKSIILMP